MIFLRKTTLIYILFIELFISCNVPIENNEVSKEKITFIDLDSLSDQAIIMELKNDSLYRDTCFNWRFSSETFFPVCVYHPIYDSLGLEETITHLNKNKNFGKVRLELSSKSGDTVFLKIPDSKFLTEKVGDTLAEDFLSTTTFILTDLYHS